MWSARRLPILPPARLSRDGLAALTTENADDTMDAASAMLIYMLAAIVGVSVE